MGHFASSTVLRISIVQLQQGVGGAALRGAPGSVEISGGGVDQVDPRR